MKNRKVLLSSHFKNCKIAHRGLHSDTVSENSLQAFDLAIKNNYAFEIDIHLLTDGELAVVHDSDIKRVTGKSAIVETLSSAELKDYPLLLNGETIPLFRQVLALTNGQVPILIELKFEDNKFDSRQADELLRELEDYPYKDMIALQSFQPMAVRYLKKHTDKYPVGYLCSYKLVKNKLVNYILKSLRIYNYIHADFISYDIRYLPNKYVKRKQAKGEPLFIWTLNTQEKYNKAKEIGDGFIFEKIIPD